ncbi:hypothetical protein BJ912DRAFT_1020488 [Pholiota molesta]|nr:hypothetical protein BJ912DRAFT_1020488 [Pholiota molesta]
MPPRRRALQRIQSEANLHLQNAQKNTKIGPSQALDTENTAPGHVPDTKINLVIKAVGSWLDIDVCDEVSERTVGRIVEEGGIAAKVQMVHEIKQEQAFTVSSDGTTIRHLNYEAKHITLNAPSYEERAGIKKAPKTCFVGVTSGVNHKSETQLKGWKDLSNEFYATYNNIFKANGRHADPITFATYMLGNGSDDSEDQKKLNCLLLEWKSLCDWLLRGKETMQTMGLGDLIRTLWEESIQKVADAGGLEAWNILSDVEKDNRDRAAYDKLCERLGEEAWLQVPEDVRLEATLFIWAGCAMHKEINAMKGGAQRMQEYWAKNELTPPLKLFNRDNAVAAAAGPSSVHDRAVQVSTDDKKGLQDTYRIYFDSTRFQLHLQGSAELLVHLLLYLDLLLEGNFNHLEYNVYKALQDTPTLTEMAALTLYLLAISYPYMRVVRGSDLGPFHELVKLHCQKIIDNPDLLLGSDANFTSGALDGKPWECPEAFYTVQRMVSTLPHLRGCLVSFCEGALKTWGCFTTEFSHGDDQKKKIFICTTNDQNKGALGSLWKAFWQSSTLSLCRHNTGKMYQKNGTSGYMNNEARDYQKLHPEIHLVEKHTKVAVHQGRLELDVEGLEKGLKANGEKITVSEMKAQLNWHRHSDTKKLIPIKTCINGMKKDDVLVQLIVAVKCYQQTPSTLPMQPNVQDADSELLSKDIYWEEAEDIEDAAMMEDVLLEDHP